MKIYAVKGKCYADECMCESSSPVLDLTSRLEPPVAFLIPLVA